MGTNNNNNNRRQSPPRHHHQNLFLLLLLQSKNSRSLKIIVALLSFLLLLHLISFTNNLSSPTLTTTITSAATVPNSSGGGDASPEPEKKKKAVCDYSEGKWIPSSLPTAAYNGTSCAATIKQAQNCQIHGRPDSGYLRWRWQPSGGGICDLPEFNPASFLNLIRHKHLAFVGDSLARNQLESLICLLSVDSPPELVYSEGEEGAGDGIKFRRWIFRSPHNATVSVFWSPLLVKAVEKLPETGRNHNTLYLDAADERWASEMDGIDVVVFSAGHWFLLPGIYHEGGDIVGGHNCPAEKLNCTVAAAGGGVGLFEAYRKAVRTSIGEVGRRSGGKIAVVATFTTAHFEGDWDKNGACRRKEPYGEGEVEMGYTAAELRRAAVEEVAAAKGGSTETEMELEVLDVTKMAMMRPDGHPGPYMKPFPFGAGGVEEEEVVVQNDCVHWCLPGPIDTWNQLLLEIMRKMKMVGRRRGF